MRSVNEITGYSLRAQDGDMGRCKDFLFDDAQWTVRYMVADTQKWFPGKKVVITPISLKEPDWKTKQLPVDLTQQKIEESPELSEHEPVSREFERRVFDHYGYPPYWPGHGIWGHFPHPENLKNSRDEHVEDLEEVATQEASNPNLRSFNEVNGYGADAKDGPVGSVDDFIVDDETWEIRYIVVDTGTILPGKKVLISTDWIDSVKWTERRVDLDETTDRIKESPKFNPDLPINREQEEILYDFYGRPHYWLS